MKVMASVRLGFSAMSENGSCGVWSGCDYFDISTPEEILGKKVYSPRYKKECFVDEVRGPIPESGSYCYLDLPLLAAL